VSDWRPEDLACRTIPLFSSDNGSGKVKFNARLAASRKICAKSAEIDSIGRKTINLGLVIVIILDFWFEIGFRCFGLILMV